LIEHDFSEIRQPSRIRSGDGIFRIMLQRWFETDFMRELQFVNVRKTYRSPTGQDLLALADFSLKVDSGRFVSVVGPSGCGKTTLLRMAAGLIPSDGGEIRLDGGLLTAPSPKMSMVFQGIGLMPWKTVEGNVALGVQLQAHRRKLTAAETRLAHDTLAMVGLKGFERYYPHQLSGGMQQRVGLARALVRQPEILLMDEPFGALDAQTRTVLQDELLNIWGRVKSTVLFITHDLDEAIYLSDLVVIMGRRPGRIKQVLEVKLPQPRYSYDARAEAEFARLRSIAWQSIKEEL
jgi:NitT/TauT family transport system ATP-binding protein